MSFQYTWCFGDSILEVPCSTYWAFALEIICIENESIFTIASLSQCKCWHCQPSLFQIQWNLQWLGTKRPAVLARERHECPGLLLLDQFVFWTAQVGPGFASASESLCYTYCLKCSQKSGMLACPKCTCEQAKDVLLRQPWLLSFWMLLTYPSVEHTICNAVLKGREQDKKSWPCNLKFNSLESYRFPSISWEVESTRQFMSCGRPWLLLQEFRLRSRILAIAQGCWWCCWSRA